MSKEFEKGTRFFRVRPGRYPFRETEVRVQYREKTCIGSLVLDEMTGWVDGETPPGEIVERLKSAILKRQAHAESVRAVMGDTPA